jgi:hypothetical protein
VHTPTVAAGVTPSLVKLRSGDDFDAFHRLF